MQEPRRLWYKLRAYFCRNFRWRLPLGSSSSSNSSCCEMRLGKRWSERRSMSRWHHSFHSVWPVGHSCSFCHPFLDWTSLTCWIETNSIASGRRCPGSSRSFFCDCPRMSRLGWMDQGQETWREMMSWWMCKLSWGWRRRRSGRRWTSGRCWRV